MIILHSSDYFSDFNAIIIHLNSHCIHDLCSVSYLPLSDNTRTRMIMPLHCYSSAFDVSLNANFLHSWKKASKKIKRNHRLIFPRRYKIIRMLLNHYRRKTCNFVRQSHWLETKCVPRNCHGPAILRRTGQYEGQKLYCRKA